VRRLEHDDAPLCDLRQRRRQQAQLADAGLLREQLRQRTGRPATAGQLHRQRWVAGVNASRDCATQLRRAPERWVESFGIRDERLTIHDVAWKYCMFIQYR